MAVQVTASMQSTPVTTMAPAGVEACVQRAPPSSVVRTAAVDDPTPAEPTAMQCRVSGHEIPSSSRVELSDSGCATQVRPPLVVATMTAFDGDGPVEVGLATGCAAGVPTAQQRSLLAQDTASSSPVAAGAGCPTTAGVPRC